MLNDCFSCIITDCECAKFSLQLPHENVFNLHEFPDEFSLADSQSKMMHETHHARTNQFVVSVQKVYIITTSEDT